MAYREHEPLELIEFNGLWSKGDVESVPKDHFSDLQNITSFGPKGFRTRDGLGRWQDIALPLGNVVRIYNYITASKNTLIVLTYDGTTGEIYHCVDATTVHGPLLTITGMEDFGFIPYAGRAYITPFKTFVVGGLNIEKGLEDEFLYVYKGDGTAARKAGITPAVGTLGVSNGAAGNMDAGNHYFAVVFETDTGALSAPAGFVAFTTAANNTVSFSSIPISPNPAVVKRHIVASIITPAGGAAADKTYFFIPNATVFDNVTTTLTNIGFFDADLFDDASHLSDNFSEIPAGVGLTMYHGRLVLYTTFDDISIAYVSHTGEPEAFDQVDGLLIVPLDGNPITNGAELRDVLYLFKRAKTVAYVDNGDVPSTWEITIIDEAIGTCVHGVATVIDSGSSSINYLLIASYKGMMIFNGVYAIPEFSWKISDYWLHLERNDFRYIQMLNDSILQYIYCALPNRKLLVGDYSNGFDPKSVKWWIWKFDVKVNTVALVNINTLIIGAESAL